MKILSWAVKKLPSLAALISIVSETPFFKNIAIAVCFPSSALPEISLILTPFHLSYEDSNSKQTKVSVFE
ncbi:hypothetical protein FACS189459_2770 [Bacilli bacterium]|nr:hypothetical protein FACS189459_2770 [Bacilli bacterium]GHU51751.1 hypothetical protein FACS189496_0650 [Bacilli bacterium]